jgi:hypothetical protein
MVLGSYHPSPKVHAVSSISLISRRNQSDTSSMFWRYIARKAATNPSDTVLPGRNCSAIDQGEYVDDWKKTRSDHMQCEFVEFSPI